MALETEINTYRAELANLIQHEGEYVLIIGTDVVDSYAAYEDALKAGYKQAGLSPFLVKQVHAIEPVQHITREIANSCRI